MKSAENVLYSNAGFKLIYNTSVDGHLVIEMPENFTVRPNGSNLPRALMDIVRDYSNSEDETKREVAKNLVLTNFGTVGWEITIRDDQELSLEALAGHEEVLIDDYAEEGTLGDMVEGFQDPDHEWRINFFPKPQQDER